MHPLRPESRVRRPLSLTLRLTLLFSVAALVVFSGFGLFIADSIDRHFEAGDTSELEVIARAVDEALFARPPNEDLALIKQRFEDILIGHHGASLYIAGPSGQPIFASSGPDLTGFVQARAKDTGNGSVSVWNDGNRTFRVLVQRVHDREATTGASYRIAVAVPIDYHLRFLDEFRRTLLLSIAGSVGIMGLLGWFAVRQGHAPLHDMVARIRRISANELNARLDPAAVPAELSDLALSFNEMLERMQEAFVRLSNFSADIAHELRTPVTNLMTQTQVALSQARSIDEYRETLYSNIEEYERMAQMVGDMLFLARAENGLCKPNAAPVDLAAETRALFEYYEAWAEERGVVLELEGTARVTGDRLMLRRALSNLLSNAIRHTSPGQNVGVSLEASADGSAVMAVENPGADIPAEHVDRLFDRFYRVDPSRPRSEDGAGLGLAIVKSIIEAHNGKISVASQGGRTRFCITLPSGPRPAS